MIIICENSYYLYLCKEYLHFYTFAGKIDVPSPPGRPSACDINVNWCKLRFLKPMNDGGSRIQFYRIEFRKKNQLSGYFKETPKINFPMMI